MRLSMVDEAGLGGPGNIKRSPSRRAGKRPRSAKSGQQSESWAGRREASESSSRIRRWGGSTSQLPSGADGSPDAIADAFAGDALAEERDTIHHEADMIRHLMDQHVESEDEMKTPLTGGPLDYLQSTMQDLFARSTYVSRNAATPIASTAPHNPRRGVSSTGPHVQATRRLSDRLESVHSNREAGSYTSASVVLTSRRSSLRSGAATHGTLARESIGPRSISGLISETTLEQQQQSGGNSMPMIADRSASWIRAPAPHADGQLDHVCITIEPDHTHGEVMPPEADPTNTLRPLSPPRDYPIVAPQIEENKERAKASFGAETETGLVIKTMRRSHIPEPLSPSEPLSPQSAQFRLTPGVPVVPPAGVEPPDLSASSLPFETGGAVPDKYVARTSQIGKRKLSRRPQAGIRFQDPDASGFETIHRRPVSLWQSFKHPLRVSTIH